MNFLDFPIGKDDEDRRIDKVLRVFLPTHPLSEIYKLIRKGLIKVNKFKVKQDYHIKNGDVIQIADFLVEKKVVNPDGIKNDDINLDIVFKNQHIIIINKPYDKTVHGNKDSIDNIIKKMYSGSDSNYSLSFSPGPLHRLDKKTTGLLAFSQSLEGARWFSEKIATHEIKKFYWGIVEGRIENKQVWENRILKDSSEETKGFHTVSESSADGKISVTYARPLGFGVYKGREITLVEFEIKTGRTHQIRFQSSANGHPLLGDTAYGGMKINEGQDFFLHARRLIIPENSLDLPAVLECEPGKNFNKLIKQNIFLV